MNALHLVSNAPELTEDERRYLDELFAQNSHKENIFTYLNKQMCTYRAEYFKNAYFDILGGYTGADGLFTPNTFKTAKMTRKDGRMVTGKRELRNLYRVKAIAIDVDYKKVNGWNPDVSPLDFYENFFVPEIDGKIPPPSYIEYGNQFRLIYILKEPVKVGLKPELKEVLKRLVERLCEVVNAENNFGAEPQTLNSYFRTPGSYNSKTKDRVHIKALSSERFTFQEMWDWMPDVPEWYEKWKAKKTGTLITKGQKLARMHNQATLWTSRKLEFEALRKRKGIPRYKLCYMYANALLWLNEYTEEALLEFNRGFKVPLKEKELKSKLRSMIAGNKKFKYSNATIRQELGLREDELMTTREKEKMMKIAMGQTRNQLAEANYAKFKELKKMGVKNADIAKALELTDRTIKGYVNRMNKEKVEA